jgi:hypothetical protein
MDINLTQEKEIKLDRTQIPAASTTTTTAILAKLGIAIKGKLKTTLEQKYPTTFPISGITDKELEIVSNKIVQQSGGGGNREKLEQGITNFMAIMERRLKTMMYSENRLDKVVNTNKFNDPLAEISHTTFTNQNFNPTGPAISPTINNLPSLSSNAETYTSPQHQKGAQPIPDPTTASDYKKAYEETTLLSSDDKPPNFFTPETRDFIYNIVIDSKDRDRIKYPKPSYFVIDFSPANFNPAIPESANTGFISRAFGNIISCEVLDVVMLHTADQSDSSDSAALNPRIPYILLDMHELGTNYQGTNDELNKCFAMLTSYDVADNYKHFHINADNSSHTIKKVYNPRINLNHLTIQIKLPNGQLWDFGSVDEAQIGTLFKISLRLVCSQKNLATNYYSKAVY